MGAREQKNSSSLKEDLTKIKQNKTRFSLTALFFP